MGMYDSLLNTAYTTKLGRAGDAAGMNQWSNQIDSWARSGMSGDQINRTVMDAFGNSTEGLAYAGRQSAPAAAAPAASPTQSFSGGYADPNQAPSASKLALAQGGSAPAASGGTAPVSGASNVNYGVYGDLLKSAYGTLGREGDAAGIDQWTKYIQQLAASGMSGEAINKHVMDAFSSTPEAMAYSQSGKNPNQIQYGATLDPSRRSGGDTYWDNSGDSSVQKTNPYSWNTEGLNFGAAPEMGATPIIDPQTGKFTGWKGKTGSWTTKDAWTAADTGIRGMSGGDESLYNQMARPIQAQNGNWVMSDDKAREAPAAFQHGPNNFMERLASYSPYIIAAMGAGAGAEYMLAPEAFGAAGAAEGAGVGTLAASSVPEATVTGSELGMLGGGTGTAAGTVAGTTAADVVMPAVTVTAPAATTGGLTAADIAAGTGTAAAASTALDPMGPPDSAAPNFDQGPPSDYADPNAPNKPTSWQQIQNYMKQGMSAMEAISKVMGGGAPGSAGGGAAGQAGGGGGIMDLLGAYYSAQQQKDLAGNLKAPYSEMQGRQNPYNEMLLKSYQDPEGQFYKGNTWKGLESVYQNSIDRNAAKGGTLANPTDRERLLQAYGMKELENYRNGLRGNVNAYDPTKLGEMYQKGLVAEAYANTAPFAAWSKAGGAQGVMNTITNTASTASDIWKMISGWFGDDEPIHKS